MWSRIEVKIPGFAHSCFKSRRFPNRFALHFVLDPRVVNRWEVFILSCLHWGWQPGEFPETWTEVAFSKQIWRNICLRTNVCLRTYASEAVPGTLLGPAPLPSLSLFVLQKIKTYNYQNKKSFEVRPEFGSHSATYGLCDFEQALKLLCLHNGDNNSTCIQGRIKMLPVKFLVQCLTQQTLSDG